MALSAAYRWILILALSASLGGCASTDEAPEPSVELIEVFPGIRAAPDGKVVEIDSYTTPFFDSFQEGDIFLELVACSPDSREHETLVVCDVKASEIHAALLLAGFNPGHPAIWSYEGGEARAIEPTGDELDVRFVYEDDSGETRRVHPSDWIVHDVTGERPSERPFIFAGSRLVTYQGERRYDADYTGTLIGLASFGSEVIAWPVVFSPESAIDTPVWIADETTVPAGDVPVVVRVTSPDG